jgi:hypothetical protein
MVIPPARGTRMKATVAVVMVWCLLVSSRPAVAQEPIESRSVVSEPVGLIIPSDAQSRVRIYAAAQTPGSHDGVPNWKILVVVAAAVVAVVLIARATDGNAAYHRPVE